MEIADSGRKHGIDDDDIRHAVEVAFRLVHHGDDRVLIIGADRRGRLLEVVVLDPEGDEPVVIHADVLRLKFYKYL